MTSTPEKQFAHKDIPSLSLQDLSHFGELARYHRFVGTDRVDSYVETAVSQLSRLGIEDIAREFVNILDKAELADTFRAYTPINDAVNALVSQKLGEENGNEEGEEYWHLRKDFVLGVILAVKEYATVNSPSDVENLVFKINGSLLGGSPNITDEIGGLDDQIDIAAAAQEVPQLSALVLEIREQAMQSITFTFDPQTDCEMLANKVTDAKDNPVLQLELLKFYDDLYQQSIDADTYGDQAMMIIDSVLEYLSRESSNALTALVAERFATLGMERFHYESNFDSFADYEEAESIEDTDDKMPVDLALHPELRQLDRLVRIAKDRIGIRDRYEIVRSIVYYDERVSSPLNLRDFESLLTATNQDEDKARLLQIVHQPNIRDALESSIGIELSEISFNTQMQLLDYMVHRTPAEFMRLAAAARLIKQQTGTTAEFYEAFLATKFGGDYGKKILSIAEHAPAEKTAEIFKSMEAFREHSSNFAGWFKDLDPAFAEATERAMNERLTDALYAIAKIAEDGKLELDVAPHRKRPDYASDGRFISRIKSLDEGIETIKDLDETFRLQTSILTAPDVVIRRVAEGEQGAFTIYRASSETHGQMLVYLREYGAEKFHRDFEYGNREGVEASASFIVNPKDPHGHLSISKDPEGVSIRFDRQGYQIHESPFTEERNPIREKGSVSLDISSVLGDAENPPVKIGRLIAAGNLLRAEEVGSEESLHHNTNGFNQDIYGTSEGFASLVRYIKRNLEAMIKIQRQESRISPRPNRPSNYPKAA